MIHKHIEDGGDLNILINDSGEVLYVCSECRKQWLGTATPVADAAGESKAAMTESLKGNFRLFDDAGLDGQEVMAVLES